MNALQLQMALQRQKRQRVTAQPVTFSPQVPRWVRVAVYLLIAILGFAANVATFGAIYGVAVEDHTMALQFVVTAILLFAVGAMLIRWSP